MNATNGSVPPRPGGFIYDPADNFQNTRTVLEPPFSVCALETYQKAVALWRKNSEELIAAQPSRPCPACGSECSDFIYASYDGHKYNACRECGCWFVPYLVDEPLFKFFLKTNKEAAEIAKMMAEERLSLESAAMADEARFTDLLKILEPFKPGPILDIGANAGQFVAQCVKNGWNAWGLENDPYALAKAEELKRQVAPDPARLPAEKWKILTMWETIEHIPNPFEMIGQVKENMSEGAVMAFTFPNLNNLQLQQMRGDCFYSHGGYNTPGHINFFGIKPFTRLLDRLGLEAVVWEGMYASDYVAQYAYLTGQTCGARDKNLPEEFEHSYAWSHFNSALAYLEHQSLTTPILFCLACRKEEKALVMNNIKAIRQRLETSLAEQREQVLQVYYSDSRQSAPLATFNFSIKAFSRVKIIVAGESAGHKPLNMIFRRAVIRRTSDGKICYDTARYRLNTVFRKLGKKILNFTRMLRYNSLKITAENSASEELAGSGSIFLGQGEYTLTVEAVACCGTAAIGVKNCKGNFWPLPLKTLPTAGQGLADSSHTASLILKTVIGKHEPFSKTFA